MSPKPIPSIPNICIDTLKYGPNTTPELFRACTISCGVNKWRDPKKREHFLMCWEMWGGWHLCYEEGDLDRNIACYDPTWDSYLIKNEEVGNTTHMEFFDAFRGRLDTLQGTTEYETGRNFIGEDTKKQRRYLLLSSIIGLFLTWGPIPANLWILKIQATELLRPHLIGLHTFIIAYFLIEFLVLYWVDYQRMFLHLNRRASEQLRDIAERRRGDREGPAYPATEEERIMEEYGPNEESTFVRDEEEKLHKKYRKAMSTRIYIAGWLPVIFTSYVIVIMWKRIICG